MVLATSLSGLEGRPVHRKGAGWVLGQGTDRFEHGLGTDVRQLSVLLSHIDVFSPPPALSKINENISSGED